ncbi:MAG: AbrB/MazE/SpoVT family DNA-binding domain-containing protein [Syntrophobacterales bacterium]|nr:AbrB/MazE/SpoVT family DNA-binding domain-containing protein [Syntrophobacterales bacterium]
MRASLTVSSRGQITLPTDIRKRMGIVAGGVVILEEREDEVALRPAAVLEIETYSDADVARWNAEDHLEEAERLNILKKFEGKT